MAKRWTRKRVFGVAFAMLIVGGIGGAVAMRVIKKGGDGTWLVNAPVYASQGCSNVHGSNLIVGFAKVRITNVLGPPSNLVEGKVECGILDQSDAEGGGGSASDFGTLVGTPGMIQ